MNKTEQTITPALLSPETLKEIADRQAAKFPGPYYWHGWLSTQSLTLKAPSGGQYVMDFTSWGRVSGQPVFRTAEGDDRVLVKARHCAITKHDGKEIIGIDNPNAIGFAKSWGDIDALLKHIAAQAEQIAELQKQVAALEEHKELRAVLTLYESGVYDEYEVMQRVYHLYRIGKGEAYADIIQRWISDEPDDNSDALIPDLYTAIGLHPKGGDPE